MTQKCILNLKPPIIIHQRVTNENASHHSYQSFYVLQKALTEQSKWL